MGGVTEPTPKSPPDPLPLVGWVKQIRALALNLIHPGGKHLGV